MKKVRNWAGNVQFTPGEVQVPHNLSQLKRVLEQARLAHHRLRVVGAAHSFTPLIRTSDVLVDLRHFSALHDLQPDGQVTVGAGISLNRLGKVLHAQGLAQENLGDIDRQSLAGAVSTGTHGTGTTLGILATQVKALTLLTATGDVLTLSEREQPDLFKAAQVSLGALGILLQVTLQTQPAYVLHSTWKKAKLSEVMEQLDTLKKHRHFEFFWIPQTDRVQLKTTDLTHGPPNLNPLGKMLNEHLLENAGLWALQELGHRFPGRSAQVARVMEAAISPGEVRAYSHQVFASARNVRFKEMEYALPADQLPAVLERLQEAIRKHQLPITFPVECRYSRGDDIFLSPAAGRETAYVAVHVYHKDPHEKYFAVAEEVFLQHQGRPHWGKMHTLGAAELQQLYPHWDRFQQARNLLDPDRMFTTPYVQQVLGE